MQRSCSRVQEVNNLWMLGIKSLLGVFLGGDRDGGGGGERVCDKIDFFQKNIKNLRTNLDSDK